MDQLSGQEEQGLHEVTGETADEAYREVKYRGPFALNPKSFVRCAFGFLLILVAVVACKSSGKSSGSSKAEPAAKDKAEAATGRGDSKPAPAPAASVQKAAYEKRWEERAFEQQVTGCFNCHETLARNIGRPAREHITSAHYRATVTCNECHGGDPKQDDVDLAHNKAMGWIGKLNPDQMNERCGSCHQAEVTKFKASKHFPEHAEVRRVTCIECHGSHDIGARAETFSWATNCLNCHDLENVPDLPPTLVDVMKSKDALHEKLRKLRFKLQNQPFPKEIMEPYREVRQLSADIVHATNAKAPDESLKAIIAKNKALEEKIAAQASQ